MKTAETDVFQGVFSLLLTPFLEDGEIDWNLYDEYLEWQISRRPNGLFAVCGSSEMKWLNLHERLELARRTVKRAGNLPVIATANVSPNPADHSDEVRRVADIGVTGIVLVPPDGLGREPQKLEEYLGNLARVVDCPVFLYEWPQVSDHLLSPSTFASLVDRYGISGIKDTTCTLEGITAKIKIVGGKASVFQANMPFLLEAVQEGAKGVMAVASSSCPDLVISFWNALRSNHSEARILHQRLVFLDSVLRFSYPATSKHLLRYRGIPFSPYCRWPVQSRPEDVQAVRVVFETLFHGGGTE